MAPRKTTSVPGALLLTPGAGSAASHPSLVAVEAAVAPLPVSRVDFPYRLAGRMILPEEVTLAFGQIHQRPRERQQEATTHGIGLHERDTVDRPLRRVALAWG